MDIILNRDFLLFISGINKDIIVVWKIRWSLTWNYFISNNIFPLCMGRNHTHLNTTRVCLEMLEDWNLTGGSGCKIPTISKWYKLWTHSFDILEIYRPHGMFDITKGWSVARVVNPSHKSWQICWGYPNRIIYYRNHIRNRSPHWMKRASCKSSSLEDDSCSY